jgi:hypothetical protein
VLRVQITQVQAALSAMEVSGARGRGVRMHWLESSARARMPEHAPQYSVRAPAPGPRCGEGKAPCCSGRRASQPRRDDHAAPTRPRPRPQVTLQNIRCDIYSQAPDAAALKLKNLYCAPACYGGTPACVARGCCGRCHVVRVRGGGLPAAARAPHSRPSMPRPTTRTLRARRAILRRPRPGCAHAGAKHSGRGRRQGHIHAARQPANKGARQGGRPHAQPRPLPACAAGGARPVTRCCRRRCCN